MVAWLEVRVRGQAGLAQQVQADPQVQGRLQMTVQGGSTTA